MNYYDKGSRENIGKSTQNALQIGKITRDEMFLALGEPDLFSEDGRRFGYAFTKVVAEIVFIGQPGSDKVQKHYLLDAAFDSAGVLSDVRVCSPDRHDLRSERSPASGFECGVMFHGR